MIKKIFYKAAIFITCLCCTAIVVAQQQVTVSATVDKNRILIGEQIELKLSVDVPENEVIRFFSIDSLPHFEFLDKQKIDTTNTNHGTRLMQVIRITSFDSGSWMIPSLVLAENIATDSIPIEVSFSPFDPNQAYHDIKDVIAVEEEKKQDWWWYAAGGGLLLLLIILYLIFRKKPKPVTKQADEPVDAYKEAMTGLELLRKQKTDPKTYYSSLIDIFRLYVFKKKGVLSLQKTTDDLVMQLRSINLQKEQFDKLAQALRLGDFVKFAKYQPSEADDNSSWEIIRQTIMTIEQMEVNTASTEKNKE
ncbi:MAG TPA: hypothetical protein VF476_00025 [Chitinophagaceae bacterium]